MAAVEVATHEHREAGAGPTAALLVDLQHDPLELHRVVARHRAGFFVTEDLVEIDASEGHEGGRGIQVSSPPIARTITSRTFIARSTVAGG